MITILHRPRRLRKMGAIRTLVRETRLGAADLLQPVFAVPGRGRREEIEGLPGVYHCSPDVLVEEVGHIREAGLRGVLLFGLPENKDELGSSAWSRDGAVQTALRRLKEEYPDLLLVSDVCLCAYTTHGHCGVVEGAEVDNDRTLELLSRVAVSHAEAGSDMVAPSDMMDGRVRKIREALDEAGFSSTAVMSYSAKYASSFYGPFRSAADSAPQFGDRSTYQMDPANAREALREVGLDAEEGADVVMVKPALAYLDIIRRVKNATDLPVAAYSVSGEYAMIRNAASAGICDGEQMMLEVITAIKRAGADIVITYFARELAEVLQE